MKKCIALIVFFIVCTNQVFSQEKKQSENLISTKWKIESIQIQQELINLSEEDNWMMFYENGIYEIYLGHEYKKGTWVLEGETNLKFDLEDSNVHKLSTNRLEFSISDYALELIREETSI